MKRTHSVVIALTGLILFSFPVAAFGQGTSHQFTEQELADYHAIPQDPAPPALAANKHFLVSNENELERFYPHVKNLGGVFLGVGTDQNYLIAGWMKPELVIVMDFDSWVVHMHHLYKLAFLHAKTPDEFIAVWSREGVATMKRWIKESDASKSVKWRRLQVIRWGQKKAYERLVFMKDKYAAMAHKSFLNSQEQYDYVRTMHKENRIVALRGDFVGRKTLNAIAATLTKYKRKVRGFYLSNAEYYFYYKKVFRKAVTALPVDEKSVILRTIFWWNRAGKAWAYVVQSAENFNQWLNNRRIYKLHNIVTRSYYRKRPNSLFVVDWTPKTRPGRKQRKVN